MAELGQTTDPVALVPGSIGTTSQTADAWRSAAQTARSVADEILSVATPDSWTGDSSTGFGTRRSVAGAAWTILANALTTAADAVSVYAESLAWAQQQAQEAIALWESARELTEESLSAQKAQERLAGPTVVLPRLVDGGATLRIQAQQQLADAREQLKAAGDSAANTVRSASNEIELPSADWTKLGLLGALATNFTAGAAQRATLSVLADLASDDPDAVRSFLEQHPALEDQFREHPPSTTAVSDWWQAIDDPALQQALITAAPVILGSLGGLPPLVRAAANREKAKHELADLDGEIAEIETTMDRGGRYATPGALDSLENMRAERDYLERAADGEVQLYLYEPDADRIIEMVGTPSETTTHTVTYVPGTFTSEHSFYDDSESSVREVVSFLNGKDPNIIGFVWKDGTFPGEADDGSANMFRITEANDPALSEAAGERMAAFQNEIIASSTAIADSSQVGMGHSWGLTPVAFAEEAGAHFDQVHSLAGAGLPAGWEETDGTTYDHWAYTDALTMAQETGFVWNGNIPANDPAFDSQVYDREGDFSMQVVNPTSPGVHAGSTPTLTFEASTNALDNHNLIASSRGDNQSALRDILRSVQAG